LFRSLVVSGRQRPVSGAADPPSDPDHDPLIRAVRVGTGVTISFSLLVIGIGLVVGALPIWPSEPVSHPLGYSATLAVFVAITSYVTVQVARLAVRRGPDRRYLERLGIDVAFLLFFTLVTYFHFNLKMWSPVINPALFDSAYMATDEWVRPLVDLCHAISAHIREVLGDRTQWYQSLFLGLFIVGFCYLSVTRDRYYGHFVLSVLLMLSLGAISFLIAPAVGPFIYESGASARATAAQWQMMAGFEQLQEQGAAWIAEGGPEYFTSALAAMPSLHVGHAAAMTYWMFKSRSVLAGFYAVITTWIAIDAVGLRWHYAIDIPFGLLLAALVIGLTHRLMSTPGTDKQSVVTA
jgi:hypothetical protein